MRFEILKAEHVMKMGPLAEIHSGYELSPALAVELEAIGGKAAVDDNGDVLAIAGIMPRWENVGLAWAWLARGWRKHARRITAEMITGIETAPYHRIEVAVKAGFHRGERWAERLGFELETPLARKWSPDGQDFSIWVKVK
jgi:hypothetical protein